MATEVSQMNRTIGNLGLIGAMVCLAWTQETAPTLEQLRQQWEQMQREETDLLSPAWRAIGHAESLHLSGQWQRPLDKYLAAAPFPMPPTLSTNRASSPLYVQVVQVSRVDAQILRNYPYSRTDFPYYEVKVRILNTWGGYTNANPNLPIDIEIPHPLKEGQEIRLIWVARRPIEGSFKINEQEWEQMRAAQRAIQIWTVGKRYLLFGYRGVALDMPYEEREKLPLGFVIKEHYGRLDWKTGLSLPPLDKFLFTVGEVWLGGSHWDSSVLNIEEAAQQPEPSFCSRVSYWVLADPPQELLQLLDEESVVLRYTNTERRQWVTQRLHDHNLPLWKKYRALLYVNVEDYDEPDQYLQWIMSLEPPLRAFGLQKFIEGLSGEPTEPEARERRVVRLFEALSRFLEAGQPVEVRREAAWIFAQWATDHNRMMDWERAGLAWDWWQAQRDWLKRRSQEESDEITRLLLDASWRQIVGWKLRCQMDDVLMQIRALEQGGSK